MASDQDQQGKWDQEFDGGNEPECITRSRMIFSKEKRQEAGNRREKRGLPQMVGNWRAEGGE